MLALVLWLTAEAAADTAPLAEAREIARWLVATGRDVSDGRVWPPDPEKPEEVVAHLYSGTSGVVLFFLEAHRLTGEPSYRAEALTDDTLARATRDGSGLRFVQAENRSEPSNLKAQTGYMQGAAGLWLLRLHAFEKGDPSSVSLPDTPFLSSSP